MKKLGVIVLILWVATASAQVPNGSFETWITALNSLWPEGWQVNNGMFPDIRATPDSVACDRVLSLKLTQNGIAQTGFSVSAAPTRILFCFGAAFNTGGSNDTVHVRVTQYKTGVALQVDGFDVWGVNSGDAGPTHNFSVDLTSLSTTPDSLSIYFEGGADSNTLMWIDSVRTDYGTGIANAPNQELRLLPNPLKEISYLDLPDRTLRISIHDVTGRLIRQDNPQGTRYALKREDFEPGLYFIVSETGNGTRATGKFLVQ